MKIFQRYFDIMGDAAKLILLEAFQLWIAYKVKTSTRATET